MVVPIHLFCNFLKVLFLLSFFFIHRHYLKYILFFLQQRFPFVLKISTYNHTCGLIGQVLSTFYKLAWLMRTFPLVYLCSCQRQTSWLPCYAWLEQLNIFLLPGDCASPKSDMLLHQYQLWHHDTFLFSIYVTPVLLFTVSLFTCHIYVRIRVITIIYTVIKLISFSSFGNDSLWIGYKITFFQIGVLSPGSAS